MKLFYKLVNKQRRKLKNCVNEFSVDSKVCKSESEILTAWHRHFGTLATAANHPNFGEEYELLVASEMLDIMDICSSVPAKDSEDHVSEQQVKEALESMNKGESSRFSWCYSGAFPKWWPCSIAEYDINHQQCIPLW